MGLGFFLSALVNVYETVALRLRDVFFFPLFKHNRIIYPLRLLNIKATRCEIVLICFNGPHTYSAGIQKIFVIMWL